MGIHISKLPATQTPREAIADLLAAWVAEDVFLSRQLRADHPLIVFEVLHISDYLTFRAGFRHQPTIWVAGCASLFDLESPVPGLIDERRFKATFRGVIRALLFWSAEADLSRENLRLLSPDSGQIEWAAVGEYLRRALAHLPFTCELTEDDLSLVLILRPVSTLDAAPLRLNFSKPEMQTAYDPELARLGLLRANEAIKDALLIQLSRLILALATPEQAEQLRRQNQQDRENAQAAAAMLRQASPEQMATAHQTQRLRGTLINSLKVGG